MSIQAAAWKDTRSHMERLAIHVRVNAEAQSMVQRPQWFIQPVSSPVSLGALL